MTEIAPDPCCTYLIAEAQNDLPLRGKKIEPGRQECCLPASEEIGIPNLSESFELLIVGFVPSHGAEIQLHAMQAKSHATG